MTATPHGLVLDLQTGRGFDAPALLALNNAHALETSELDAARLDHLLGEAFAATAIDRDAALLIAFDQNARYDSPNFIWFQNRYARFVYVDRIIVHANHRGRAFARHLYEDLFARALRADHDVVVCEVNVDPPNPGSDAFHSALGFSEVGRAVTPVGKTVRYLQRGLTPPS
jgi:uncharacterized protein